MEYVLGHAIGFFGTLFIIGAIIYAIIWFFDNLFK